MAGHRTRPSGIGLDHARIDCKAFGTNQPFTHATLEHSLKDMAEGLALAKATVPVLGKRRVLGDCVLKSQPTEPPVRQVQVHLLAPLQRIRTTGASSPPALRRKVRIVRVAHDEWVVEEVGDP